VLPRFVNKKQQAGPSVTGIKENSKFQRKKQYEIKKKHVTKKTRIQDLASRTCSGYGVHGNKQKARRRTMHGKQHTRARTTAWRYPWTTTASS
jgi:hypothetical protein